MTERIDEFPSPEDQGSQPDKAEVQHREDLAQQAEAVLSIIEEGQTEQAVDLTTADLVQATNAEFESGAITQQDAEEAVLVGGLAALKHTGQATPFALAHSPHTLLAEPLVTIEKTRGMQQLEQLTQEIDAAQGASAESAAVEFLPAERPTRSENFIAERLKKNESIVDVEGIPRPAFQINEHKVVFRNRQEAPIIEGKTIRVVHPEVSPPLPIDVYRKVQLDAPFDRAKHDATPLSWKFDTAPVDAYNAAHSQHNSESGNETLVVTNTLEGMVGAAKEITTDSEQKQKLESMTQLFAEGKYNDPKSLDAMDAIMASITIDDEGKIRENYDTDGYALALASIAGDKDAGSIVDQKVATMRNLEATRVASERQKRIEFQENRQSDFEAVPVENLALVHSTSHAIERDADGNVVLTSAGQKREDMLPRASLHFTVNSRVENNDGGTWDTNNKLIVANLARTIDASGRAPTSLAGMDTWFTVNPGEKITLPGAIVIEGRPEGPLIDEKEESITYLSKESYTDQEIHDIQHQAKLEGIRRKDNTAMDSILRDIALTRAMTAEGIPKELQDEPSQDGHGMWNGVLGGRIRQTSIDIGASSGKHFDSGAPDVEKTVSHAMENGGFNGLSVQSDIDIANKVIPVEWQVPVRTSLEERRQHVFSGYLPARPPGYKRMYEQPPLGGDF